MDELNGPVVAYVLLLGLVVVSLILGNVPEELGVTQEEFFLAVTLFTVLPGLLLFYMWRTT